MTTEFTPARIAELRALGAKATKLPYRQHLVDDTTIIAVDGTEIACTFPQGGIDDDVDFATDVEQKERDAAFLAAAANTLPAALDEIERLRGLLWFAWSEFNAIRARSGAPLAHDGMTTCDESWWSEMTDKFADAIGPEAHRPWPSVEAKSILDRQQQYEDAKRLRAEVERLREALKPFARLRRVFGGKEPDDIPSIPDSHGYVVLWAMDQSGRCDLTLGQFRRARRALEGGAS